MDYLRWSKLHAKVRYELTVSGVPSVRHDELGVDAASISLDVEGPYGNPTLIELLAGRYGVAPTRILPVSGASLGNFVALAGVARHGDTVMLEQPVYEPIRRVASFLDLKVIPIERRPDDGFDVSPAAIESGLRSGAGAVVLTNLHNPSGRLLAPEAIERVAALCSQSNATLIVDEVYLDSTHLNSGGPLWTAARHGDNVIAINSLTKVYGLSGLRIGWLIMPERLMERMQAVMDLLSVNNAAPAASLAVHALRQMERWEGRFRGYYAEGRPVFETWLAGEPLVTAQPNYGAIFECVRLPAGVHAARFNDRLAHEYETQVVPGTFFDLEDHIRLSTTLPAADLEEALARISTCLREFV